MVPVASESLGDAGSCGGGRGWSGKLAEVGRERRAVETGVRQQATSGVPVARCVDSAAPFLLRTDIRRTFCSVFTSPF